MKKVLADNWIIITIGIALMGSLTMAIHNNSIIRNNIVLQKQTELVKKEAEQILSSTLHGLDLGARGFGLTKDTGMLIPYNKALIETEITFYKLDSLLKVQDYTDRYLLAQVKHEVDKYVDITNHMIHMAKVDSMNAFIVLLKQDKGYDVWKKYDDFTTPLFAYEDQLNKGALSKYNAAIRNNLILQVSIIILALPALFMFVYHVRRERESRLALLKEVEENERRFVFNSGETQVRTAKQINDNSISNSRHALHFIKSLATGEYAIEWPGLSEKNKTLNEETLAGNLMTLRQQLIKAKIDNQQRNSTNEALAQFSDVVRSHQHDPALLADKCVAFLVQKIDAQQASLFLLEGEGNEAYLKLASCYAFNKKKLTEGRIEIGNGLLGQAFLEGSVVQLKKVPQDYITITSGLGEAPPQNLIIVPLTHDVHTMGVLEMASFNDIEDFQIELLRKAGEVLASTLLNAQNTAKMKQLLDDAMGNEQKFRSTEEMLRDKLEMILAHHEGANRVVPENTIIKAS